MDPHSLHVLEYDKVIDRLATHTSSRIGHDFALQLEPVPYTDTVRSRLQETREARRLLASDRGMPLGGVRDIRQTLERARLQTCLTPRELLDVLDTSNAGGRLRAYLMHRRDGVALLADIASHLPSLPVVEQRISACVADSGDIRDTASPELARTRAAIKILHSRLQDRLQNILASDQSRSYIQEFVITVREDRYCIPVKAEYARAFGGLVHDTSQSGATVFIEPAQAVDLGNELKQLSIKEEQEVDRLLRELSGLIGSYATELQQMVSVLGHLDVIQAKALLADEMDATEPLLNASGVVKLRSARHPLLPGAVVPIDVELGERFTALLITGPNTGGKTVTLKTIGLLTLMTLAGLQIPAGPDSEVSLFQDVYADIGDEQDIQQSLSTFSAHLKNIVRIRAALGDNALVLLDEIGAGTDPAEGAALAKALLDHLMSCNARVVATTHYGELKEFAYARPGVENASVEFDRVTLSPTYHIMLGVPGMSNALYIAGRLGLPEPIVDAARGFLSHREIQTGELIREIEQSRRAAAEAEREAARARNKADSDRVEYAERLKQIADVQRTVRAQAQADAEAVLRRATDRADNIIQDLQRLHKAARKATAARKRLGSIREKTLHELKPAPAVAAPEPEPLPPGYVFNAGETVTVLSLDVTGQVLDVERGGAVPVQVGALRVTLPVSELRPVTSSEAERENANKPTGASAIAMRKAMQIGPELMLRAMRVDEAQPLLEKYVDDAYAAGLPEARIIHGVGTGALRRAVWSFLEGHPAVESYNQADRMHGGEGATIVTFKK